MTIFDVCCVPLGSQALGEADAAEMAAVFKVLADPARLRVLSLIASAPAGEACACELVDPVGRSQPTISHHLALLTGVGLVSREKRGKWAWYRIVPERLAMLRDALATPAVDPGTSEPVRSDSG